ncbi:MAG: hypothetical protein FJ403_03335 [Verrucomicrobia bacterium]|nr:hypothetical protein [Verrucomicrobiota bacterium]
MTYWLALGCTILFSAVITLALPEAIEIGPDTVALLPGGKEADGIIGDFLLRNDQIEAVISGNLPLRRANMSTFYGTNGMTPGCLYDLALRGPNNDQLTIFSPCSHQGQVSFVRIAKNGADGEAIVETVITAPNNQGVYRRHEYRLKDGWRGLLIATTIRNERRELLRFTTSDRWTTFTRTGQIDDITWADAVDPADKAGYAYGWVEWNGHKTPPVELKVAPGEEFTFARFVAVGRSPAEAVGRVMAFRGQVGDFSGEVIDPAGQGISTATVLFRKGDQTVPAYPNANGRVGVQLGAGEYGVEIADLGRASATNRMKVVSGQRAEWQTALGAASAIAFEITDESGKPMPCKAQFIGTDGAASPDLGPPNRAHGCRDQYHSENGRFRVQVPAGSYRVIVTRGIEFSHLEKSFSVGAGETIAFKGSLKRLVNTRGWVSADYHNHSTPSGDNTCGTDDRIINLVAEHIEFAPATEHNRLYDWRPHIERLGLTNEIQTVSGIELTGSGPHFNSFPFKPEHRTQDNGAPVWNRDPRITAVTLRDWQGPEPDRWIQINHPDLIENFTDRNGDGLADSGYIEIGALIDGVEVQNFRPSNILAPFPFEIVQDRTTKKDVLLYNREFIWLQLLNRGHRLVGMAVSDAHSVHGNGVGGWRMYMPSVSDVPNQIDWRENSRHAKAGRSILTTGPFLEVTAPDGHGPGSEVRSSGGITLKVRVQCTDWIDIDRVQVLVNGRPEPKLNFTRRTHPDAFERGVVKFEREIHVPLTEDAHIIVVAYGENGDLSFGYGSSDQAKLKPCAFNNPIYVDVDGRGFKANGDMLDYPLMTKRYTIEQARRILERR